MDTLNTYLVRAEIDYRADRIRQSRIRRSWRPVSRRRSRVRRLRDAERDH
jgi:hypothetical protein